MLRPQRDWSNEPTVWAIQRCRRRGADHTQRLRGQFNAIGAGGSHVCGVRTDNTITCAGVWGGAGQSDALAGQFTAVAGGSLHSCGLRTNGTIACWGRDDRGQLGAPAGRFTSLDVGINHSCGLRDDGTIACWGDNGSGQASTPAGEFTAVSTGWFHSCGVRVDGTISCWGPDNHGQVSAPSGQFTASRRSELRSFVRPPHRRHQLPAGPAVRDRATQRRAVHEQLTPLAITTSWTNPQVCRTAPTVMIA